MTANGIALGEMRWRDYVQVRGVAFDSFWKDHTTGQKRRVLFILGRGFDPRASMGLARMATAALDCSIDIIGLSYVEDASGASSVQADAVATNWAAIQSCVAGRGTTSTRTVKFRNDKGVSIAARSAADLFGDTSAVESYTDVIVDISAMPRVIYFPLISRLIYFHDDLERAGKTAPNVHVVISEDPRLDMLIKEQGVDEAAGYLHPFEGPFSREARGGQPTVWIPVLGEGRTAQFDRICELVKPGETCPVLPSPARNPRRGDDIVIEHQSLLFDQVGIDPRNIIYASESNPFDLYRQARRAAIHYHDVLELIGGCRVALSAMCSKVMSLGILLVAYELKSTPFEVGIAHVECQGYEVPHNPQLDVEPVSIWLAGECYRRE